MARGYVGLIEGDQPVLLAALLSSGFQRPYFERATGWSYGIQHHKYESGGHSISRKDFDRLRETVAEKAGSGPALWSDYVRRCASGGARLIEVARSLVGLAGDVRGPRALAEGFTAFATATREVAPFLAATPEVRAALESSSADRIAGEIGGADAPEKAAQVLSRFLGSREEPEAVREIRSCYRIALEISENGEALELVRTRTAAAAVSEIKDDFPELHGLVRRHVDEYGWIRTHGYRFEPLSPEQLVERIQIALLRWKPETIRQAAEAKPASTAGQALGFSPSESLGKLMGALQDLTTLRCSRVDVHLQASSIARPFFDRVAAALGCTQQQLMFGTAEEIIGALTETSDLPWPEIDRRIRDGFVVERSGDNLRISSYQTPSKGREGTVSEAIALAGQSVSLGRAVGRVRVIFEPTDVRKLEAGDVLVTAASTPDLMGITSVFPSRTDAPPGMERVAAIVTDEGGLLSHAGIISRELGVPCIVGTERATRALADGQVVEVDATRAAGRVIVLGSP
jgi:phosphohistidine swiveling domain-containing protein/predicted DNA-binding transcriptional regulator